MNLIELLRGHPDCGEAEHYIVTEADADCSAKEEFSDRG